MKSYALRQLEKLEQKISEDLEEFKKNTSKSSREKMRRDLGLENLSRLELIDLYRFEKDMLILYPDTKTTQPKFYNVFLILRDAIGELGESEQELLEELRQSEELEFFKENILKLSREEMKRDLGLENVSQSELTDRRRLWEEFLTKHPEIKTTQPELYNKLLIFCDVVEEFEIKERRDSFGGLLTTGAGTGFKIAEVVIMILLAILGIAFVVTLVRSML